MTNETQTTGPRYDLLLCVAEHAKTIPDKEFHPHSWWEEVPRYRLYTQLKGPADPSGPTEYRGCVLGHVMSKNPTLFQQQCGLEMTFGNKKHKSPWVYGQLPGIDSVAYAFGIPLQDAIALFLPSSYGERAGKMDYSHRIEQYVQAHQQEGVGSCKSTQGT